MMEDPEELPDGCLALETLATYLDGRLAAASRARVEAHLAACGRCRRLISVVVKTEDPLPTPPTRDEH